VLMRLGLGSRMVKTPLRYLVLIKSYSKNTHPPFYLKWAVVVCIERLLYGKVMITIRVNGNNLEYNFMIPRI
jgi:hypothetical protein